MEIKAYPLDDTSYLADDLRHWQWNRTSGVYSIDTNLQVITNNNMTVTVKKGVAFLNNGNGGISSWIDNDKVLNIDPADGVLNRIDSIVIGWDIIGNKTYLEVKKGILATTPIAPSPQRDTSKYEIVIAQVKVNKGIVSITSAMLTDTRLNEVICGLVRDGVEKIPTSSLQTQAENLIGRLEQAIVDAGKLQIIDGTVTASKIDNSVLLKVYPVGSIYISIINTNPSTLFGGTWMAFAIGQTLIGVDTSQTEFNTVQKTGGAKTHVHGSSTMTAGLNMFISGGIDYTDYHLRMGSSFIENKRYQHASLSNSGVVTNNEGSDVGVGIFGNTDSSSTLSPYITVYMWKRTA